MNIRPITTSPCAMQCTNKTNNTKANTSFGRFLDKPKNMWLTGIWPVDFVRKNPKNITAAAILSTLLTTGGIKCSSVIQNARLEKRAKMEQVCDFFETKKGSELSQKLIEQGKKVLTDWKILKTTAQKNGKPISQIKMEYAPKSVYDDDQATPAFVKEVLGLEDGAIRRSNKNLDSMLYGTACGRSIEYFNFDDYHNFKVGSKITLPQTAIGKNPEPAKRYYLNHLNTFFKK